MKKLEPETIHKVADLARLHLSDDEVVKFSSQMEQVLNYIEKLNGLETSSVEPMTHPLELTTALRPDETRPSLGAEALLASAPEHLYDSFKVPQVMSGGS
jgi:aspartyl-tRNA(Asn)/glutamyl-tRNA(Gln) amidotransferase subunit C